ncbi:18920_t:CDS:2, partial [Racocetra fulgida]
MEDSGSSTVNSLLETEQSDHSTYANKKNKRGRSKNLLWTNHFMEITIKKVVTEVLENDEFILPHELQNFIQDRQFWEFWANTEALVKVLSPAKNAVKIVESKTTTTADIFLFLIQIAAAINMLKKDDLTERIEFRKQCMKNSIFHQILQIALEIWKKIGGELSGANTLVAQIKMYDAFEPPYNYTFVKGIETSQTWWNGCKFKSHPLQKLALYLLAITPHSASCERIFSIL